MKRLAGIALTIVALLAVVAAGCNTSGCLENSASTPLAGFYAVSTQKPVTIDSLEIGGVGAPNDSLLLKDGVAASSVYLPLRSDSQVTAFYIRYRYDGFDYDFNYDTITIEYSSIPYFVSEECGAMYRYRINRLTTTYHMIDSVVVTDSLITNIEAERLKIYFAI